MPSFEFDLQRYIQRQKGAREAEAREGAGYAYAGDARVRRAIGLLKPVSLALAATAKLWRLSARAEVLGPARKVSERSAPRLYAAAQLASKRLHVGLVPIFVSPGLPLSSGCFGTDDEPQIVVHAALEQELSEEELLHVLGGELSRVQNHHVLLFTAEHYAARATSGLSRWAARPALTALGSWERRARISCDRAGLLCTRDLPTSSRAIDKLCAHEEGRVPLEGAVREAPPPDEAAGEGEAGPDDPATWARLRKEALAVFARGAYFRAVLGETGGLSAADVDRQVARLLRKGPGSLDASGGRDGDPAAGEARGDGLDGNRDNDDGPEDAR